MTTWRLLLERNFILFVSFFPLKLRLAYVYFLNSDPIWKVLLNILNSMAPTPCLFDLFIITAFTSISLVGSLFHTIGWWWFQKTHFSFLFPIPVFFLVLIKKGATSYHQKTLKSCSMTSDVWISRYLGFFHTIPMVGNGSFPISGLDYDPYLNCEFILSYWSTRVCFLKHDQKSGKSDYVVYVVVILQQCVIFFIFLIYSECVFSENIHTSPMRRSISKHEYITTFLQFINSFRHVDTAKRYLFPKGLQFVRFTVALTRITTTRIVRIAVFCSSIPWIFRCCKQKGKRVENWGMLKLILLVWSYSVLLLL